MTGESLTPEGLARCCYSASGAYSPCSLPDGHIPPHSWDRPYQPSVSVPKLRAVRMSDELFHQLGARRVEWGQPDDDGFYTPIVFTQDGQEHVA